MLITIPFNSRLEYATSHSNSVSGTRSEDAVNLRTSFLSASVHKKDVFSLLSVSVFLLLIEKNFQKFNLYGVL